MNNAPYPIVTISLDNFASQIKQSMALYATEISEMVSEQVNQLCTVEHLHRIIRETSRNIINTAIKEEIENFFKFGEGRHNIMEAVRETLGKKIDTLKEEPNV